MTGFRTSRHGAKKSWAGWPELLEVLNFYRLSDGQFIEELGQPDLFGLPATTTIAIQEKVFRRRMVWLAVKNRGEISACQMRFTRHALWAKHAVCKSSVIVHFSERYRQIVLGALDHFIVLLDSTFPIVHCKEPVGGYAQ